MNFKIGILLTLARFVERVYKCAIDYSLPQSGKGKGYIMRSIDGKHAIELLKYMQNSQSNFRIDESGNIYTVLVKKNGKVKTRLVGNIYSSTEFNALPLPSFERVIGQGHILPAEKINGYKYHGLLSSEVLETLKALDIEDELTDDMVIASELTSLGVYTYYNYIGVYILEVNESGTITNVLEISTGKSLYPFTDIEDKLQDFSIDVIGNDGRPRKAHTRIVMIQK